VISSTANRNLILALGISLMLHGGLLMVRFVAPEAIRFKPTDPGLEVVLVNTRHDSKPVKAEALAQANLDGGGNADAGRAKSPLPNLRKVEDGQDVQTKRQRQKAAPTPPKPVVAQTRRETPLPAQPVVEQEVPAQEADAGDDADESVTSIARMEAEIDRRFEELNKRPKKIQITPSTREVGYAMYYNALQQRIERIGTLNFPRRNGRKLYGELVVYIPVLHDGSLYDKEGGPRIEKSSGNPALDQAALNIVRRAAPFGRFPDNMRSSGRDDVWEIITRFKFTREDGIEATMHGSGA